MSKLFIVFATWEREGRGSLELYLGSGVEACIVACFAEMTQCGP